VLPPQRTPRMLLDVTQSYTHGVHSGIPRVVRKLGKAAVESGSGIPVILRGQDIVPYYRHRGFADELKISAGDILVLLDLVWHAADAYFPIMQAFKEQGGSLVVGVHDLIPLLYPGVSDGSSVRAFRRWLEGAVALADALVTISKTTAFDLRDYIVGQKLKHKPNLGIGWFNLGADFDSGSVPISKKMARLCSASPFVLTVGMIDPRKCHSVILDAFDRLWRDNVDVRYMIIGKYGWNSRAVRHRILSHTEFGRRLLWLDRVSDADLLHAYRRAAALVFASFAEGFGLPVVEAAHCGAPVIASDIPVFREIGGDAIFYFDLFDGDSLAQRIRDVLVGKKPARPLATCTWHESMESLQQLVRSKAYQLSV